MGDTDIDSTDSTMGTRPPSPFLQDNIHIWININININPIFYISYFLYFLFSRAIKLFETKFFFRA